MEFFKYDTNDPQAEQYELLQSLMENWEDEIVEFKTASGQYSIDKIGQYFSAISNEANLMNQQYGWFVLGVSETDKKHVVGTAFKEGTPQLLGLFQNTCVDSFLVDADELAILHEELAVGDGGLALSAGHAEDHVAVNVGIGEGGEGLVVHDDHIGGGAGSQLAHGNTEEFFADEGVVFKEHIRDLAPTHIGHAGVVPLGAEGHLDGLQHIVGVGVGAHTQQDAPLVQLQHGADADGVEEHCKQRCWDDDCSQGQGDEVGQHEVLRECSEIMPCERSCGQLT